MHYVQILARWVYTGFAPALTGSDTRSMFFGMSQLNYVQILMGYPTRPPPSNIKHKKAGGGGPLGNYLDIS